jgi:hypothetical protein
MCAIVPSLAGGFGDTRHIALADVDGLGWIDGKNAPFEPVKTNSWRIRLYFSLFCEV